MDNLSISKASGNDVNAPSERGTLEIIRKFVDDMGIAAKTFNQTSKDVFNQVVKDKILKNCKERHSEFISSFEYSGNLHQGLITEDQDDDDAVVLVILKTKKNNSDIEPEIHKGYGKFKVIEGSHYKHFCGDKMFVDPAKMADWICKEVQREVQQCRGWEISLTPPQPEKNHVVKLTINMNSSNELNVPSSSKAAAKSSLTVILLPVFVVDKQYFVPLEPQNAVKNADSNRWRQSFAMEKKEVLQGMDKDGGCRHDLYKVVATVLKREPTFSLLLAHIKMIFIAYIMNDCTREQSQKWKKEKLAERFEEFLYFMADSLKNKQLMHFWLNDLNILSTIRDITQGNMEKRIRKILSSQQEKEKVLTF